MAADLGLVTHAAERQAHELAVHRPRDRLGERGLADARRSDEREDGRLRLLDQRAHREELEDALLDLVQAVVVLVEDHLGALEVAALLGLLVPRHRDQPVEIVARDRCLRRHRWHRLEPLELLDGLLLDVLRHPRLLDLLLELFDLVALLVLAAQLLLDRLHLLVEVVLLLCLLHLLFHARLDAAIDLEFVHLGFEDADDAAEALERRDDLEQVLLFVHTDEQVRGDGIGELARIVHAHRGNHRVVVQVVRQLDVLLEQRDHLAHRLLDVAGGFFLPLQHLDDDAMEAFVLFPLDHPRAIDALDQQLDVAVGKLEALHHVDDAAHRVDVVGAGVVHGGVVLRREEDSLVLRQRMLQRPDGRRPSNHEGQHHVRKNDNVSERNDWERFVDFDHISGTRDEGPAPLTGRRAECPPSPINYPAFSMTSRALVLLSTISRVTTHSRVFF